MATPDTFLAKVEAFLARHHMKPATFGRLALKDPGFVFDLRKGRDPSLGTAQKIEQFMADADAKSSEAA